jgi:hypothetical protein
MIYTTVGTAPNFDSARPVEEDQGAAPSRSAYMIWEEQRERRKER